MREIGQFGTFDVENYGDLLYPLVFERILRARGRGVEVTKYSFQEGEAPQGAGFQTRPARSLFAADAAVPGDLVIGGGDILRTDWDVVAWHYKKIRRDGKVTRRSRLAESLRYRLRKARAAATRGGRGAGELANDEFRARWMNYPAAGPFIIDPDDLAAGGSVSYFSCGVPHEFDPAEWGRVGRVFDKARFICLRDELSREKLERAGVRREMRVAPDAAVTLSDYFDPAEAADRGREILSRAGVDVTRPVLCFQSSTAVLGHAAEIGERLRRYRRRTGTEVALVPLGYCHRDHEFLTRLAEESGGELKYVGVYSVLDMMSVVAAGSLFLGSSLHGNVTAFSFGVPHLFAPNVADKCAGFLRAAGLPPELGLGSWAEANDKLDMAAGFGRRAFSERAREAKARVYAAADELLAALPDADPPPPKTSEGTSHRK
jgi:hypothetical protein